MGEYDFAGQMYCRACGERYYDGPNGVVTSHKSECKYAKKKKIKELEERIKQLEDAKKKEA